MLNFKVIINNTEYDMIEDFQCYPQRFFIGEAEPKLYGVDVPYSDGELDYTNALSSDTHYKKRNIEIPLKVLHPDPKAVNSEIANLFSGKVCKIILDDEEYYYRGRVKIGKLQTSGWEWLFQFTMVAEPYKIKDVIVHLTATSSGTERRLNKGRKAVIPTVTTDKSIVIAYDNKTASFDAGTTKNPDFYLTNPSTLIEVTGQDATVVIKYEEGSL